MNANLAALFELYTDAFFAHEAIYAAFDDGLMSEEEIEDCFSGESITSNDYEENDARARSKADDCQHEEKHWDAECGWVCSICYKPLSGIDYAEIDRLEREHEDRMDAEASLYQDDDYDEEFAQMKELDSVYNAQHHSND
jgi:hypothetical protein